MSAPRSEIIHDAVRLVIHAWDPYALLAGGASDDVFAPEIAQLAAQAKSLRSEEDAAKLLSKVFSKRFGSQTFRPADCRAAARRMVDALRQIGVLRWRIDDE